MAEVPKLLYIVVEDDERRGADSSSSSSFRYTRRVLQSTLQLMGCKARHAFKISRKVFEVMRIKCSASDLEHDASNFDSGKSTAGTENQGQGDNVIGNLTGDDAADASSSGAMLFELYKRLTTVVISREHFLDIIPLMRSKTTASFKTYQDSNLLICSIFKLNRIRERKESVTILLCGTSGCGKSTLSSLLGSRLGVTTVISTDSIRHMMRSFVDETQNPLLWSSTYHAGEHLDPASVAEAKAKRKAKKLSGILCSTDKEEVSDRGLNGKLNGQSSDPVGGSDLIGKKQMAIEGFKAQSEMVIGSLDRLITSWEERKESVVVEGVHLSLNFVMGLMKKHPSIIPFMVYIANEDKHLERFAVRAKYMTLDPAKNKYVKYIRNIRAIQEYLCNRADKHLVPKINNTNVDQSVAAIQATVFSCLRRREAGEQLYDASTNTVPVIDEEYRNQCAANSLSSKGMFQLIQRKGSSRHLMALVNMDGSVAKAWPVHGTRSSGYISDQCVGNPMYGPLQIGKSEPVNLQFGNFGISAWPSDTGGTSHAGSIDDTRADGTDTGSRCYSSCCSSPKYADGPAKKEPKEEFSVSGSEEEADDPRFADSDEDLSDVERVHEEIEGSVDEDSTKSDEEYEDLAMRDSEEDGYWSDDDGEPIPEKKTRDARQAAQDINMHDRYQNNLNLFLKTAVKSFSHSLVAQRNEKSSDPRLPGRRSLSDSMPAPKVDAEHLRVG